MTQFRYLALWCVLLSSVKSRKNYNYHTYSPVYQYSKFRNIRSVRQITDESMMGDQSNPGPNVCMIKEVFGTGERFYQGVTEEKPTRICDRPTFMRPVCCPGYSKDKVGKGCPITKPLTNIVETAKDRLFLLKFTSLITNTELESSLQYKGAYTAFIPIDNAFNNISYEDRERLHPWSFDAPSLVHYHVVKGRYNVSKFHKNEEIPTLYYGAKSIRINKYAYGVTTVNCARIIIPNQVTSNGIIHVIDRMIKPFDARGNLADVLLKEEAYGKFSQLLYKASLVEMLQGTRHFTIFAPTNAAFDRLPKIIKEKILTERSVAEAIVKNHIVKGVHCGASTILTYGLHTLQGRDLTFRCKYNGNYINDARLLNEDIMTGNGIIHIIDKVLMPDTVKNMLEIAETQDIKTFIEIVRDSGLIDKLQTKTDITVFAPNDAAFAALPKEYMISLKEQPGIVDQLIDYHTVHGRHNTDMLMGNQLLETELKPTKLKVGSYINGLTIDDAHIVTSDKSSCNGVLHVIDKVLVPPGLNLLELLGVDPELSNFKDLVKKAGLSELFTQNEEHYSVFAPSNKALRMMTVGQKKIYMESEKTLKLFIERHMVNRTLVSIGMSKDSTYSIPSVQSEFLYLTFDLDETTLKINKDSKGLSLDMLATNGVLFKIDNFLECECCKYVTKEDL